MTTNTTKTRAVAMMYEATRSVDLTVREIDRLAALCIANDEHEIEATLTAALKTSHWSTFVTARPRPGVEPKLSSRWSPRYVWTLHRVPVPGDARIFAVRRRLLFDDEFNGMRVETPGGDMSIDLEELEQTGHTRGSGNHRAREKEPRPANGWGCDLCLDVYDHPPTPQERRDWLVRHYKEQALIARPPASVWVSARLAPGKNVAHAVRCPGLRSLGANQGDIRRSDYEVHLPGYKPPKLWAPIRHMVAVDFYKLAVDGWTKTDGTDGTVRVYLEHPSPEQLKEDGRRLAERGR